jgi:penicillin-binding protein 1A
VGGVGQYEKNQWNRALSPHTMGSCFKPFVYLSGFLNGQSPDDIIVDAPVSFPSGGQSWSPRNFEGGFMGAMTIRKALSYSRNVCAAKVAHEVGIQNVIATARQAGLTSTIEPYLPISLGAAAASPLEMAGAYSTFARGGVQITPRLVRRIENNEGTVIATYEPQTKKVFDSNATAKLLDCMQAVITSGTGLRAKLDGRPVAGKTGTSDAARDIWFCGFTADTATAVWGGNDHNQAIHGRAVTGGMVMAAIFKDYMDQYYKTHPTPVVAFMQPAKDAPKIASGDLLMPNAEAKTP